MKSAKSLNEWLKYQENSHPLQIDLGLERVLKIASSLPSLKDFAHKFKFFNSNADLYVDLNSNKEYEKHQKNEKATGALAVNYADKDRSIEFFLQKLRAKTGTKIITIAGTNGKGSTAIFLQNLLLAAGFSTGAYTSPHIKKYNERFLLNGFEAQDEQIISAFEEIYSLKDDVSLSYFEWSTLTAFVIFARYDLDFWIMEVGLGGRLDAVNIANADIGIITSIGRDHQEYLGTSLNGIGNEKAGIFCEDQISIFSSRLMPLSIEKKAQEVGAKLVRAGIDFSYDKNIFEINWQGLNFEGRELALHFPKPKIGIQNATGALQAFCFLTEHISASLLRDAVKATEISGRMQKIDKFVLDVAHNPPAMVHLTSVLEENVKRLAIIGMLKDKDIMQSLQVLAEKLDDFYMISLPSERGTSKEAMFAYGVKAGIDKDRIKMFSTIDEAINMAHKKLDAKEIEEVLILGSFITLELALSVLQTKQEIL